MAISKIIYKTSSSDTGTVWMDVTQKTVTAGSMLSGTTALKNDGTDITGNIASKTSSDLTANVLTVTAPAGHYASAATKTLTDQYLLAENIKKDISIFGVTGTYEGGGGSTTWETVYNGTVNCYDDIGGGLFCAYIDPWSGGTIDLNSVWRVTLDGVQYECTATWYNSAGDPYAIGNYTYDGGSGGTEYPFMFQTYWSNATGVVISSSGNHTFKLEKQVSGGGSTGLEYETGTWTPASDIARGTITFSDSHDDMPVYVMISDATGSYSDTTYSGYLEIYVDYWKTTGSPIYPSSTSPNYCREIHVYRSTGTTSLTTAYRDFTVSSDDLSDSSVMYPRYWVKPSGFNPYLNSSSNYWRAGRTYKWIAVWGPST